MALHGLGSNAAGCVLALLVFSTTARAEGDARTPPRRPPDVRAQQVRGSASGAPTGSGVTSTTRKGMQAQDASAAGAASKPVESPARSLAAKKRVAPLTGPSGKDIGPKAPTDSQLRFQALQTMSKSKQKDVQMSHQLRDEIRLQKEEAAQEEIDAVTAETSAEQEPGDCWFNCEE